jgi:hypothetical protein
VALWRLRAGTVELEEPFVALAQRQRRALDADAADLVRFLAPAGEVGRLGDRSDPA